MMMLPQSRISSSSSSRWFLLRVLFLVVSLMTLTEAWVPTSQHHRVASRRSHASSSATTKLGFFGAAPVDDMTPGDYACKDCDFVFTKGPKAWAALPDNYSCPKCGAPKRRFSKVPKGGAGGKGSKTSSSKEPPPKKKGWF